MYIYTNYFGTNGRPYSMLTLLSNELCRPLYIIFNSSLISGNIPIIWKKSIITPILKRVNHQIQITIGYFNNMSNV